MGVIMKRYLYTAAIMLSFIHLTYNNSTEINISESIKYADTIKKIDLGWGMIRFEVYKNNKVIVVQKEYDDYYRCWIKDLSSGESILNFFPSQEEMKNTFDSAQITYQEKFIH